MSAVINIGDKIPDFTLQDANGNDFHFYDEIKKGPLVMVFYPGDFTPVCTKQLCNYRDDFSQFERFGARVVGISKDSTEKHAEFQKKYNFPFPLITDTDHRLAKMLGCTSKLLFGSVSRAFVIASTDANLVYRHVEPLPVTHPRAEKLLEALLDLKQRGAL